MVNKLADCVYAAVATYITSLIHVLDNNWISCLHENQNRFILYFIRDLCTLDS